MLLKPRFGNRMWSGIWPPSKPFTATPERLFWPFWPRPAVLPRPDPMPRPTRTRPLRAPGLSRSSLILMVMIALAFAFVAHESDSTPPGPILCGLAVDPDEVRDLAHLAEHFRRGLDLNRAMHLVEAQADQSRPLGLVTADRRSGLGDLDLRHHNYSVTASAVTSASP